jgi:hypothetical protein
LIVKKDRSASQIAACALLMFLGSSLALAATPRSCLPAAEAAKLVNKDVCVSAHIYDVVQLTDGTRFLDVCSPETPDEQCRFTVISLWKDRKDVGDLTRYKDKDVRIRGIVRSIEGRAGIVLSHTRQFSGGKPKFSPNPLLAQGFNAEQERPPVSDPNLRSQGGRRSFMNRREQKPLPQK